MGLLHYLGPSVGKVPLSTWDEIRAAAVGGMFEETQWVELKERPSPPNKATNAEVAKDLASLSVDGGVLVYGVRDKDRAVVGCDVTGLADRIAQVAAGRVHPPLSPVVYPVVTNPDDTELACLVVEVPPSPVAPHMVEESYWGRSSNGKRRLSDPEVRRLMHSRESSDAAFRGRLLGMQEDDPVGRMLEEHPSGNAHVYLLAEPCAPAQGRPDDFALDAFMSSGVPFAVGDGHGDLAGLRYSVRDSLGLAMAYTTDVGKVERKWEDFACYLLLSDADNSLEFTSGGGSMCRPPRYGAAEQPVEVICSDVVASSTLQFFQLLENLSLESWGYSGQWRVGIHVTNLGGKPLALHDLRQRDQLFRRDCYTNQVVTAPASWVNGPEPEARQLLTGFLREIGCDGRALETIQSV